MARALGAFAADAAPLLVACSGGPDSSAALVAVARSRERAGGGEVVAATFDHGLRPSSETKADRAAVEALAARLGLRCLAGSARTPLAASEAAAREARYRWLGGVAREIGAVAGVAGHTLDDQAETVLLRLTRGTGLAGAAGMADAAPWPVAIEEEEARPPLRLLRPLLGMRRGEIEGDLDALGLAALGLEPRIDPSNELLTFDRNRVRRRVLPQLRRLNPRVEEALAGFANRARRDDEALGAWAKAEAVRLVRFDGATALIERRGLGALPEAVSTRVLRDAAARLGLVLHAGQLEALLRIAGRGGARLDLAGGRARVEETVLRIESGGPGGG